MDEIAREEFVFAHPLRVRWSEVDAQGIVFNPHYLAYADLAIGEYMRAIGFPYPDALHTHGSDTFAVHAELTFKASARFDDELDLAVRVVRIGRTSLAYAIGFYRGVTLLCSLQVTHVNAGRETQSPLPWPQAFIDAILGFERRPPERK